MLALRLKFEHLVSSDVDVCDPLPTTMMSVSYDSSYDLYGDDDDDDRLPLFLFENSVAGRSSQ
jgi:hypothetical protein